MSGKHILTPIWKIGTERTDYGEKRRWKTHEINVMRERRGFIAQSETDMGSIPRKSAALLAIREYEKVSNRWIKQISR